MKNTFLYCSFFLIAVGAFGQRYLTKTEALEDLTFFHQTLLDVHYNPFLYIEAERYNAEAERIKASIPDTIAVTDFMKSLYKLTALLEDSHSMPAMYQGTLFGEVYKQSLFFPLHTLTDDHKLYVSPQSDPTLGIEPGAELISINGVAVDSFLAETYALIGGLPEYKKAFVNRLLSHFLFISGVQAPFTLRYKTSSGQVLTKTDLAGVSYVKSLLVTMPGLLEGNRFKIIDDRVGYIDFCNMSGSWQEFSTFLDSAFVSFQAKNIKHVAIDLRHNSGGDSMLGDVLFSYLTDQKYRLMGTKKWKISSQYKAYLKENGNTSHPYLTFADGTIWESGDCTPQPNNFTTETKFTGEANIITCSFTFSSRNMVASGAKTYKIGTLVGQPTGEATNDFGEVYRFELPNSAVVMHVTTSFDIGPECDASLTSPVLPDVFIAPSAADLLNGEDPELSYILEKTN